MEANVRAFVTAVEEAMRHDEGTFDGESRCGIRRISRERPCNYVLVLDGTSRAYTLYNAKI